jgi:hypothetical protein
MAETQPLLVFDTTAILASQTRQWQEWARFGQCVMPLAVYQDIEFLTQRAIEPQQEAVAREFVRYSATGDFVISDAEALVKEHEEEASQLSKRLRLVQAIAECAYALAKQQVGTLVVVVSNDRPLVDRIQRLQPQIPNLAAISVAELVQWNRLQQRPRNIDQALRRMPGPAIPASAPKTQVPQISHARPATTTLPPTAAPPRPPARASVSKQGSKRPSSSRKTPAVSPLRKIYSVVVVLISLSLLTSSGLVGWRLLDPEGSEKVWNLLRLPEIPGFEP